MNAAAAALYDDTYALPVDDVRDRKVPADADLWRPGGESAIGKAVKGTFRWLLSMGACRLMDYASENIHPGPNDYVGNFVRNTIVGVRNGVERWGYGELQKFKWLAHRVGFAVGSSTVQQYYTVMDPTGKEHALYIRLKGDRTHENDIVYLGLKTYSNTNVDEGEQMKADLKDRNKNTFDRGGFNDVFAYSGAMTRLMNGESHNIGDLTKFNPKIAKIGLFITHQYGKRTQIKTLPNGMKIMRYDKAGVIPTWLGFEAANMIYDTYDTFVFNPLEAALELDPHARLLARLSHVDAIYNAIKPIVGAAAPARAPLEHYT
jgi:hypothetical protein